MLQTVFTFLGIAHSICFLCLLIVALVALGCGPTSSIGAAARSLAIACASLSTLLLATYLIEYVIALQSQNPYERDVLAFVQGGPQAYQYWLPLMFGGCLPQLIWVPKIRHSLVALSSLAGVLIVSKAAVSVLATFA